MNVTFRGSTVVVAEAIISLEFKSNSGKGTPTGQSQTFNHLGKGSGLVRPGARSLG